MTQFLLNYLNNNFQKLYYSLNNKYMDIVMDMQFPVSKIQNLSFCILLICIGDNISKLTCQKVDNINNYIYQKLYNNVLIYSHASYYWIYKQRVYLCVLYSFY